MKEKEIILHAVWREAGYGGLSGKINRQRISPEQLAEILKALHPEPPKPKTEQP